MYHTFVFTAFLLVATSFAVNAQGIQSVGEHPTPHYLHPEPARGTVVYGGFGLDAAYVGGEISSSTPWSVGIYARNSNRLILGFDVGREGTLKDYTAYRGGAESQSISLNFLIGGSFLQNEDFIFDSSLLLGLRPSEVTCPNGQSFVGYRCYADVDPHVRYDYNLGVLFTAVHRSGLTAGVRSTRESIQGLVGWSF